MTREEAIAILEVSKHMATSGRLYNQAIDMAKEALQREEAEAKGYCHRIKPKEYFSTDAEQETVPTVVRVTMSDGSQYYLEHERDAIQADAVHGEWIKKQVFNPELDKYVPLIECSVCGYEPYFGGSESKFNYCANCGARMKGGGTE